MGAQKFISSRLKFKGRSAFWATAVSALVMVVAVCVCSGMRTAISGAIRAKAGDALICPVSAATEHFPVDSGLIAILSQDPEIQSVTPVISVPGAVRTPGGLEGVICKGVDEPGAQSLSAKMSGACAKKLKVSAGERICCYFVVGGKVKARNFTVSEVSDDFSELGDVPVLECPIADMRRLQGWAEGEVSGIELQFTAACSTPAQARAKAAELGCILYGKELMASATADTYHVLYEWLDMINANVLAILVLMSIVAAFNMISALLILIMRSISTIGTLKALGMTSCGISKVFFRLGSVQVLWGLCCGGAAGIVICLIQSLTHLFKLDASNYFIDYVPINVNIPEIVLTGILAWAVISAFLLLPCRYISRIDPARTVKAD